MEKTDLFAKEHPQTNHRLALSLIFLIMLMDVSGITILYPVAPYIVRRYSDQALMVTLLTVIYAGAQFFAAPLLGKLSDRYGRRPVLLVSILGSAVGYVIFGIGGALWLLFLARMIDGITAGNMSTASAYIADISKPEERAKNFGLIGVAWGVGLILGPALGALLGQLNLALPAFTAAAFSFFSLLLVFLWLPESLPKEQRETTPIYPKDLNPFGSIGALARRPVLGRLLLGLCLFTFSFQAIASTQSLFLIEKFTAQPWQIGLLLALAGVTVAVVQAALVQPAVSRYGEQAMARTSLLGQAVSGLAVFFAPSFWLVYPLQVFSSSMSSLTFPSIGTLASNRVSASEQGMLMGVTTSLNGLMSILGPLWAGAMYDRVMPGAPYWMGAIIFCLAAIILRDLTTKRR